MQKIGFIGLGIMGAPMAANLVKAGYEVTGYARSSARPNAWCRRAAKPAGSIAEAVAGADVVITMLPDSPAGRRSGAGRRTESSPSAGPDLLLIDMSTIAPETSVAVAKRAQETGARVLDAPVSGGEPGAIEGSLSIMVGGDAETFEEARPILEHLGKTIVHVGESRRRTDREGGQPADGGGDHRAGQRGHRPARSVRRRRRTRPRGPGRRPGRQPASLTARLPPCWPGSSSLASGSTFTTRTWASRWLRRGSAGVSLPVTGVVAQLVASARAMGHGSLDHSALLNVVEAVCPGATLN